MERIIQELWNEIKQYINKFQGKDMTLDNKDIFLFGTGMNGILAFEALKDDYEVDGFLDNNPKLWGSFVEGIQIFSPDEILNKENSIVIITTATRNYETIKIQLDEIGASYMTWLEYQLLINHEKFRYVYEELLCDLFSKETYLKLVLANITGKQEYRNQVYCENQYFALPDFNIPLRDEIFIDCGAYVGDTIESYIKTRLGYIGKIIAFEPNERVFSALEIRKKRLIKEWALEDSDILIEKKAIGFGRSKGTMITETDGNTAARVSEEGVHKIEIVSLDEYLLETKQEPLFVKVDVEGYEKKLLYGAEQLIKERKPLIAISIYHKVEDFYEIPMLIKEWNPSYKMAIRSHLPNDTDTILYCY